MARYRASRRIAKLPSLTGEGVNCSRSEALFQAPESDGQWRERFTQRGSWWTRWDSNPDSLLATQMCFQLHQRPTMLSVPAPPTGCKARIAASTPEPMAAQVARFGLVTELCAAPVESNHPQEPRDGAN